MQGDAVFWVAVEQLLWELRDRGYVIPSEAVRRVPERSGVELALRARDPELERLVEELRPGLDVTYCIRAGARRAVYRR
ncbi:hypothetical protein C3Y87_09365 [Carbonactinospora thermoautotrophica]|nr:hypothetical protein [Carbonactinospora thermoautotrophica]